MEFSDTYKHTGSCSFSPNSRLLAVAVDYRLVIRDVVTLKVVQLYSCLDKINHIEWAPDSEYILCGLYKRAMVQAWSVSQPEWTCKIDEGSAGIAHARWSPDSRHILTPSAFQLRITVWSLVSTACVHVQWPKHTAKGVSFTKDGKFVCIATRRDCKDYANILACNTWEVMGTFAVDTVDLADIVWSPNDSTIAIWDSPLEYKVLVYSPDGRCLFRYQAYENTLGVKTITWSPCGQFLGVGSYDQVVRVLNHLTWKPVAEFVHLISVKGPGNVAVFKEIEEPWHLDMASLYLNENGGNETFQGLLEWSADSRYLLTKNDNMPTALWIWDVSRLELTALLLQKDAVRMAAWDPVYPRLALCTGSSHLYMWTPAGACCVTVPLPQFLVSDLKWNLDGTSLLLKDRDAFCCTFVPMLSEFDVEDSNNV